MSQSYRVQDFGDIPMVTARPAPDAGSLGHAVNKPYTGMRVSEDFRRSLPCEFFTGGLSCLDQMLSTSRFRDHRSDES